MSSSKPPLFRCVPSLLAAGSLLTACANAREPKAPASPVILQSKTSNNWVCRGLMNRFLGLPSAATDDAKAPAPLAGRWWIRGCELGLTASLAGKKELLVHLEGPGWYWVDFEKNHLELHQQVPFELSADIMGTIRFAYSDGVASLWFEPTREANVQVKASANLELHGATPWGSLLRRMPLLPIRSMTADRLSDRAANEFGVQMKRGITVTYDLAKGQADMALGELRLGETPRRVFEDGTSWIENDRLLLPAGATQVFGPLEPSPIDLDVVVERGPGVVYRAMCASSMPAHLKHIAEGRPDRIPEIELIGTGLLTGGGSHSSQLEFDGCPYYLIVSSARDEVTLVALRLSAHPRVE
jgi:hypothetical protein